MDSIAFDVCCVSEKQTEDSTCTIQLTASNISSICFLCTSGDSTDQAESMRYRYEVKDQRWNGPFRLTFSSGLFVVMLHRSAGVRTDSCVKCSLFVISVSAPTDCCEFHDKLVTFIRRVEGSDTEVVARGDRLTQFCFHYCHRFGWLLRSHYQRNLFARQDHSCVLWVESLRQIDQTMQCGSALIFHFSLTANSKISVGGVHKL